MQYIEFIFFAVLIEVMAVIFMFMSIWYKYVPTKDSDSEESSPKHGEVEVDVTDEVSPKRIDKKRLIGNSEDETSAL